jgi:hypothetical protein
VPLREKKAYQHLQSPHEIRGDFYGIFYLLSSEKEMTVWLVHCSFTIAMLHAEVFLRTCPISLLQDLSPSSEEAIPYRHSIQSGNLAINSTFIAKYSQKPAV